MYTFVEVTVLANNITVTVYYMNKSNMVAAKTLSLKHA